MTPYNQGYLAGQACGSYWQAHVLRRVPRCPFVIDTQDFRAWFIGLLDNVQDRAAAELAANA